MEIDELLEQVEADPVKYLTFGIVLIELVILVYLIIK